MATDDGDSPLTAAAGAAGPETIDAFELLANETRLAILLALWDASEPLEARGVTFSELQDRVGVRDSGQFNYHLGKLEHRYVQSTDSGYQLTQAGKKITRAVIGGAGLQNPTLEPTELDLDCPLCSSPVEITYRDGHLYQRCTSCEGNFGGSPDYPDGMLYRWRFEPAGLTGRTPEEVWAACSVRNLQRSLAMVDGVCPECSGAVTSAFEVCDDHERGPDDVCPNCGRRDEVLVLLHCSVCKYATGGSPGTIVTQHPAVIAFYYDHGVATQYDMDYDRVKRLLELGESHENTVESRDPPLVRVTVSYGGDELSLVLDEGMSVIDIDG